MRRVTSAALFYHLLLAAALFPASSRAAPILPPSLAALRFGMTESAIEHQLPKATHLDPGLDFGPLRALLVLPEEDMLGTSFRVYLQFDGKQRLRQLLLERRHAGATRDDAHTAERALLNRLGPPDERCFDGHSEARMTWKMDGRLLHLIGIDDLAAGILTQDAERSSPLAPRPLGRSRKEKQRARQERSLPQRILIRIHSEDDKELRPPPCDAP